MMTKIRLTDISPDGVRIIIDWDKFISNSSIFIPCINTAKAIKEVREVAKLSPDEVRTHIRIENGKYGVRIWRTV